MIHLLLAIIYLSFISLGLPDALLGAAWPTMYQQFQVPVSYMGAVSLIISSGTVVSSLLSDRLTRRFGTGRVTSFSVAMTAAALLGFSFCRSYWVLCLWAIPYGLGAGSVDASLNNYVAIHFASRHMSWLHCMWGLGASIGPYIMGYALSSGQSWNMGYRYIGLMQAVLTAVLLLSLPIWKEKTDAGKENAGQRALTLRQILAIPGAKEVMITFFCYCAVEQTAGQWASSYLVLMHGLPVEEAASLACLFYIGITAGRAVSGFLTIRFRDIQMIHIGEVGIGLGVMIMLLPFGKTAAIIGLLLIGLGCAPIFPCALHSTPAYFGEERSQALIGVQMASAYIGICLMPPLYGLIASRVSAGLLPICLLVQLALMTGMYERLNRKAKQGAVSQ